MPRYNQPRKTWRYTNEFKVKAVQLSQLEGVRVQEVATTLDIHPFMLSRWRKEYREGKIVADKRKKVTSIRKEKSELDKIKQLEKEVARLRQENDLLKVATVSCGGTSERYRFIARNRDLGVKYLCGWLGVSRSGYYDWLKRPQSERVKEDAQLSRRIETIYQSSRGTYGSPRVFKTLKNQGEAVGRKRVERLMREKGLQGRVVKVTRRCPGLKRFVARGENLRLNGPSPSSINQVWASDVTYLKVNGQWRYLATVMDVFSRRILGWSLDENRSVDLSLTALRNALRDRLPGKELIFHTDRGIEYTSHRFRRELRRYNIRPSVNRPGCCTDNAHMESFFHTLKAELIRGNVFHSDLGLRYALNDYISHFYNHRRLHSGIGYLAPAKFEAMAA